MDDHTPDNNNNTTTNNNSPGRGSTAEPVRSRWTPKPEQILILESIFNSGMVNPPKDETVRIRKLLEKFGAVGDANVFYWFQNHKARDRQKLRRRLSRHHHLLYSCSHPYSLHCLEESFHSPPLPPLPFHHQTLPHFLHQLPITSSSSSPPPLCHCFSVGTFFLLLITC